ncbi:MAG: hypothetical protein AB7E47_02305 [Desulfovibrionaceae bacterium]
MWKKVVAVFSLVWAYKIPICIVLFGATPASTMLYYYQSPSFQTFLQTSWPAGHTFASGHEIIIPFGAFGIIALSSIIMLFPIRKAYVAGDNIPLNQREILFYLRSLELPVGKKLKRFCDHACEVKRLLDGPTPTKEKGTELFLSISRPRQQMIRILESIHGFYLQTTDPEWDLDLHVVLFFVTDNALDTSPELTPLACPEDSPLLPLDMLMDPRTPISKAIRTKQPVIIPDTAKPGRGMIFVRDEDEPTEGSLLLWPIEPPRMPGIRMVLSLYTPGTPKFFKKKVTWVYKFILDNFARRLALEYGLLTLKLALVAKLDAKTTEEEEGHGGHQ